jgi:hypothetical protein
VYRCGSERTETAGEDAARTRPDPRGSLRMPDKCRKAGLEALGSGGARQGGLRSGLAADRRTRPLAPYLSAAHASVPTDYILAAARRGAHDGAVRCPHTPVRPPFSGRIACRQRRVEFRFGKLMLFAAPVVATIAKPLVSGASSLAVTDRWLPPDTTAIGTLLARLCCGGCRLRLSSQCVLSSQCQVAGLSRRSRDR